MKTQTISPKHEAGNALIITMMLSLAAFITVAGIMSWSAGSARLTSRSNQYSRSIAAAEAATEKVMSQLNVDFINGGEALVSNNLASYKQLVPTSTDSAYWTNYQFSDAKGHLNRTYVNAVSVSQFTVLTQPYAGLFGYISTYDIVSDASETGGLQTVTAGVLEEVQLTRIPIFQFSMYSSDDMEISCGQPFTIDGRVHSNGALYVEPDNVLTFNSLVSSVGQIYFAREPADPRGDPAGSVVYLNGTKTNDVVLTLPIGMSNTSAAIQQIIQPPPAGEDINSPLGQRRYYNQADMIIKVTPTAVTAVGGPGQGASGISIPNTTNHLFMFVSTNNWFYDNREGKKVLPLDIDIGKLVQWSKTNQIIRAGLGNRDVVSIYVWDTRASVGQGLLPVIYTLPAVRVWNGTTLPPLGLTVATSRPMYVQGNYNQSIPGHLARADTSVGTKPASLVGDALTILSPAWVDANNHTLNSDPETASEDTVNAAIIAGSVYTTSAAYSGGMENFPRFLESWGSDNTIWYNGSMVKMFASVYATNVWGKDHVYDPPARSYYFDPNFTNPLLLPPLTPSLQTISRNRWSTLAANQVTATNTPW